MQNLNKGVHTRLLCLYQGFTHLQEKGYPIEVIPPQGAIYLSLRINLIGRGFTSNEEIRVWLLQEVQIAAVPFQAFDMKEESGWFRLSVGTATVETLEHALVRLEQSMHKLGVCDESSV